MDSSSLVTPLLQLVAEVAEAILPIYQSQDESLLTLKNDGSPLTQADILANELIQKFLTKLTPQIPILSEESCNVTFAERQKWSRYWLVDPIDGTKEFLAKNGDFTINIALIEDHQPILGIVALPAAHEIYYACKGQGAWKKTSNGLLQIHAAKYQAGRPVRIVASRRHGHDAAERIRPDYPNIDLIRRGSSLKFCLLAEGLADLYPRLGFTSEWDTAAAQCVLEEAGGKVIDLQGLPLQYNLRDAYQNPYFLAVADPSIAWQQFFLDHK